jgi:aquaporin Z
MKSAKTAGSRMETKEYLAEFVGTFVLVLGGVGCAVLAGAHVGQVGIAFAFGLALLAMCYAIGPISGCHINPAVTFALMLRGKIAPRKASLYMAAQVCGAVLAAGIVLLIAKGGAGGYQASVGGLGANGYGAHSPGGFGGGAAFICEVLMTALLCFTVLGATDPKSPAGFAGLPIGLVLTLIHLVSIPVTNTSVNPARSIGPALFVGGWAIGQLWMFIVAPLIGAGLAALVDATLRAPATDHSADELNLPGMHRSPVRVRR